MSETEKAEIEEMVCPKCGKTYKRQGAYDKHVASCKGHVTVDARKEKKPKKTEEELADSRRAYVRDWVKTFTTTTIRLKNDSEEEEWLLGAVEEVQNDFENAGRATVLRLLILNAIQEDTDISELANQYLAESEEAESED